MKKYYFILSILSFVIMSCANRSIEPTVRQYIKDGEKWYEKRIYCYPEGKYPSTEGRKELAEIQHYRGNQLWEAKVFYEFWPNGESKFVSKEGFYTYKNGESQLFNATIPIPDNIIVDEFDSDRNRKIYYYKNGKRVPYTLGYPNGIREHIYTGDTPGIYVWKDGKRILEREFGESEKYP